MEFRSITEFPEEFINSEEDFQQSIYCELPRLLHSTWKDLRFCFEDNTEDNDNFHELLFALDGISVADHIDEEFTVYYVDESIRVVTVTKEFTVGICVDKKDVEEIKNIYDSIR
jgi:hypothetical protein